MRGLSGNRLRVVKEVLRYCSFAFLFSGAILLAGVNARAASLDLKLEPSVLKPGVLYIDLANPTDARGITLGDDKQAANLTTKEVGGMTAAEPKDNYVLVKLDTALVKEETPLLVAFSYYDSDRWDEPEVQGFLPVSDPKGQYTHLPTFSGAYSESWRWWTSFTYANYSSGYLSGVRQSSFRLKIKDIRRI
ncbi:MAG: hypothetical protein WC338_03345, partial [Candidatus Ratteibacteria bacterium]